MPYTFRLAFCKFRCGVAPPRIETGRFENLPVDERKCCVCNDVETEIHVILYSPLYDDYRNILGRKAERVNGDFINLNDIDKLRFL